MAPTANRLDRGAEGTSERRTGPTLSVTADDFVLLDANGDPVENHSSLAERTRDDWYAIPELATAYDTIQSEYRRGPGEDFDSAVATFRSTTITCNHLVLDDAMTLVDRIDDQLRKISPPRPRTRATARSPTCPH